MSAAQDRALVVTLDAEAQPARSDRSPLDHLIHGEAGAGGYGLWRVLDIADEHGATVTVFLDYAELDLWGEGVLDVGREVARRGHDLQLHLHPEFLSPARYEAAGLDPVGSVAEMSREQAALATDMVLTAHDEVAGTPALAFRGGGYHVSDPLLAALVAEGVTVDSSFVPHRHAAAARGARQRPFRWTNGMAELPVGAVPRFRNLDYPKPYNFNATFLLRDGEKGRDADETVRRHHEFADAYFEEQGADAPLVMIMHSWSLLRRSEGGVFGDGSELAAEALDRVLADAARAGTIRCVAQVAETLGDDLPLARLEAPT